MRLAVAASSETALGEVSHTLKLDTTFSIEWHRREFQALAAIMREIVESIEREYRRYQALGQGAIQQLTEEQMCTPSTQDGNSVAKLVWHLAGNFKSRFVDFLTADGEKPWRDRESEFSNRSVTRDELVRKWNEGWNTLFEALSEIRDDQLAQQVTIRGVSLDVRDALHRSLAHASYHVGQIVLLARQRRGSDWQWLSIPPGKSAEYNENPTAEKGPETLQSDRDSDQRFRAEGRQS